jgi:pseudouridine-5'-phosphate glycosidase
MNKYLDIKDEVKQALKEGRPVVALESTIISHGMPYPKNVETALRVEQTIRDNGAVPATIAIIGGRLKVGLTAEDLEYFGKKGPAITKVSRRDIALIAARGQDGATTVAATMIIAAMAGVKVFATGGIGGVHRGAEKTMDISADLDEFTKTPMIVVCAGAKAILDLNLTMEYLETKGVPVFCYRTDELPAFYTKSSGIKAPNRADSPKEIADIFNAQQALGMNGGILVTNPIPDQYSMDPERINAAIDQAIKEMEKAGIHGKETTPYLLDKVQKLTGGDSLESNIMLVLNNAGLAAKIASQL